MSKFYIGRNIGTYVIDQTVFKFLMFKLAQSIQMNKERKCLQNLLNHEAVPSR